MATQQSTLVLGPDDQGRLVSAEEFATAEFVEPWRYERVHGRLVVMSPAGQLHINGSEPWRDRLVLYKVAHLDRVQHVVEEAWARVDEGSDRIGDLGVYLVHPEPAPPIPDRVPDLMFEVVSPDRRSRERDYILKRAQFHALGVREYVIIDRAQRRVTVLTQAPEDYQEQVLTENDVYRSPLLPGLEIPLAEVF